MGKIGVITTWIIITLVGYGIVDRLDSIINRVDILLDVEITRLQREDAQRAWYMEKIEGWVPPYNVKLPKSYVKRNDTWYYKN